MMKEKIISVLKKVWKIIKFICKWITCPVWLPWKILFVRKEERKFKNVNKKVKLFRIVRSPITKPLKFILFLLIIILEVSTLYKVRNFVMAPLIRKEVHQYYLKEDTSTQSLSFIGNVYANDLSNYEKLYLYDEFKDMFLIIDEQEMQVKNNFYAILNSDLVKRIINEIPEDGSKKLISSFNEDIDFQEAVIYIVKNINTIIPDVIKARTDANEINPSLLIMPAFADVTMMLDILNTALNVATSYESGPVLGINNRTVNILIEGLKIIREYEYDYSIIINVDSNDNLSVNK